MERLTKRNLDKITRTQVGSIEPNKEIPRPFYDWSKNIDWDGTLQMIGDWPHSNDQKPAVDLNWKELTLQKIWLQICFFYKTTLEFHKKQQPSYMVLTQWRMGEPLLWAPLKL